MTSTASYSERVEALRRACREAEYVIIGAGAGLSTAAGLDYGGEDFRREFAPWIERYGISDLYTSSFYPFASEEERWAYWAKHIWFSRYRTGTMPLYGRLLELFERRSTTFVVTTNTDGQFEQAGFDVERIFATQGDYRFFQPASGSPKVLVDNREWVERALPAIEDCRIPPEMVPTMPDGQAVAMNLRCDDTFVEDSVWHRQAERYTDFVRTAAKGRLLLLEFGIGYNTPGIIRVPFEQMAQRFPNTTLVRFNRDYPELYLGGVQRFVAFTEDIEGVLNQL